MPDQPITYTQPEGDEEFLRCREYLYLREMGIKTPMPEIATHFGISHATMYRWLEKWTNSGLLARCREKLQTIKFEGIDSAESNLLEDWPGILDNLRTIAKSSSYRNAIEAARLLEPTVTKLREAQKKSAVPEQEYIEGVSHSPSMFDPLDIPAPTLPPPVVSEPEPGIIKEV